MTRPTVKKIAHSRGNTMDSSMRLVERSGSRLKNSYQANMTSNPAQKRLFIGPNDLVKKIRATGGSLDLKRPVSRQNSDQIKYQDSSRYYIEENCQQMQRECSNNSKNDEMINFLGQRAQKMRESESRSSKMTEIISEEGLLEELYMNNNLPDDRRCFKGKTNGVYDNRGHHQIKNHRHQKYDDQKDYKDHHYSKYAIQEEEEHQIGGLKGQRSIKNKL